jgi:hypothetical protein
MEAAGNRSAVMMRLSTIFALSLATALAAKADDGGLQRLTRLAAASNNSGAPAFRLGMPPRPAAAGHLDLGVLLIQNGRLAAADVVNADDTILVALALSTPTSVDEDVARQHGLELVDRTELPELGLRIVRLRAPDGRAIDPILAGLRNDQRIRTAQRNLQYGVPGAPPAGVVAATPGGAVARRRAARKAAADGRQRLAGPAASGTKAPPSARPLRVGNVGDVLSGGL